MTRLSTENAVVRGATRQPSDLRTDVPSPLLGDDAEWSPLLEQVDIVVHAAARAHVLNENAEDPLRLFQEVNTAGTLRLARQAAEVGVKRFLFLSSIGVNGTQSIKPFNESDTPQPVEPYAVSKREAEQGLMELSRETGMEVVIIRPPLVYGPSAPGNFGKLANAVRRGIPLPLGAVTQNRRTLVGLDNLVDLIMTCAYHPAAANQVFLAGDDEDLSTADLLHRMAKAFGVSPRLLPVPVPVLKAMARAAGKSGMVERLCGSLQVDITKAREVLGWKPPLTVDEGLARVAAGF
ncbi:NAD-dependent epimerase/dehydratase family protein [Thauera sp. GDN1]|uniref:NAD-dependent epimerase/dehydratase family protein n=1 Tax=Thauera sp. GDN1 TaxID=2944810 RepID=UPI0024785263|nr:NAD-dependent epimerase/dehydratase family protein [Thauera sp. GDN1]